jgi:SAM-dependent methyltransferase
MKVLEEADDKVLIFNGINARFWVPRSLMAELRVFERPTLPESVLRQAGASPSLAQQFDELRRFLFLVPANPDHREDMRLTWDCLAQGTEADVAYFIDNETRTMEEFRQAGAEAVQALQLLVELDPSWHVVNIGCGMGRLERFLAPRVSWIAAVDVSDAMIERARRYLAECPNVDLLRSDGDLAMLESGRMDLAISFLVFQHCPKEVTWSYFREVSRVLKPGGVFLFQIHCYADDIRYETAGTSPAERYYGAGKARYLEDEIRRELTEAGFRIEWFRDGDNVGIERRLSGTSAHYLRSKLIRAVT